ncbi:phosphatidylserine decarboxylase [Tamaricihabitans halophyticus]|uniref:Phosphatidylserine decarboxylase proenzyme n=1 Tax=Tamaricihabitans halophyticus TaxID=1262583 RepID=A0A4R2RA79_9PSEU|nr:phosphatidylserine decarboxylase [Tamaricihabitans halophyticus]TCP56601.1 phosphatidylserine decarboxylase [Tamaricihabitans halophyticus]
MSSAPSGDLPADNDSFIDKEGIDKEQPRPGSHLGHLVQLSKEMVPPMHPAGRPFVLGAALGTLLLRRFSRIAGILGAITTAWVAWFFREPRRVAPERAGAVAAPADGTVAEIVDAPPPAELGIGTAPMRRISVFLSVFDVHVQRIPMTGEVTDVRYRPGKFLSADLDKASEENERNTLLLTTETGEQLVVVQIAGLVARRIRCDVAAGARVGRGETYGLIRFGSRVDTYLPLDSRVLVHAGQRTIGGETVLAELPITGTSAANGTDG